MAVLPLITDEDATPEQQAIFDGSRALLGRVSNSTRLAAASPKLMQPLMGFFIAALRQEITGELDVWTKMLVIVKTSMLNGCAYCIGHNTTLGRALGLTEEQTLALEGDYRNSDLFTDADKAAITWAECLTERNYHRDKSAMTELKAHFNDIQVLEITMVSGFFNFWNRFNDAMELDIEDADNMNRFKKSTVLDPADYVAYMRSCWWNAEDALDEYQAKAAE